MDYLQGKRLVPVVWILALACLVGSLYRCQNDLVNMIAHADNGDLQIFVEAARQYQIAGQLYLRPVSDSDEAVASLYRSSSALFKFPPAFQLQLLPFANDTLPAGFFMAVRIVMVAAYLLACFVLMLHVAARWQSCSRGSVLLFYVFATVIATSSDGLRLAIFLINYEIPIFVLLVVGFFLYRRYPAITALLTAYLASVKLYPVFMVCFLLIRRDGKVFAMFILGMMLFFILGYCIFGEEENVFFFRQVLPALLSESVVNFDYNMSVGGVLADLSGNLRLADRVFQVCRWVFVALTIGLLVRQAPDCSRGGIEVFALLMALMLICLPNYWQAYQIMLFPAFCIATCRIVARPRLITVSVLLVCVLIMSIDINAWSSADALSWFGGESLVADGEDEKIQRLLREKGVAMSILILASEYPWITGLYCLAKLKCVVPFILWFFVAAEILTPALRRGLPSGQLISSNPERCRRA